MKGTLERQLEFVKNGWRIRVDPRARLIVAFELIDACFKNQGYRLSTRSPELAAARYAASVVLRNVNALTQLVEEDEWVQGPHLKQLQKVSEPFDGDVTQEDIVVAMDLVDEGLRKMLADFSAAEFPEHFQKCVAEEDKKEREYARYKCAAFLPLLVRQMADLWEPLEKKILQGGMRASRADRSSRD